jgi:DNA-binding MarR family transcriptional regulator
MPSPKAKVQESVPHPAEEHAVSRAMISTLYLISYSFHASRTQLDRTLRKYNLTDVQFTILDILSHRTGQSSADLSRRFFVTPQTMGEMVTTLERRGLIERVANPTNRRILQTYLTAEGQRLHRAAAKDVARVETQLFKGLDAASLRTLRNLHFKLNAQLRQVVNGEK